MKKTALNRRDEIAKSLMQDGQISTQALAREYGVSVETIRKDLLYLQKSGIAKKGYGGAVVCTEWNEQSFGQKSIEHQAEKARIAGRALDFVCDGDIVIQDSGSTVAALARLLLNKKRLTVFTNSLYAAQTLSPADSRVYLLGGAVQPTSNASTGHWALQALGEIRANTAFLGTSGFYGRSGPCVENFGESEVKKAMIAAANKTVLLADSSKERQDAMIRFAGWEDIDLWITDGGIGGKTLDGISDKTEVIVI